MSEAGSSTRTSIKMKFTWSKETTIHLIELYQNHPVLYVVADENYKNKNLRQAALEDIRSELLKLKFCSNQCLNINDIKTKIHTLRTQFFKEWGKVKASERTGTGVVSIYQPKLWCYEELAFLKESECTTENVTNLDHQELDTQVSADFNEATEENEIEEEIIIETTTESAMIPKKKGKLSVQREVAKLLSTATTTLREHHNDQNHLDCIHTFAMSIAAEMRKIKNPQRVIQLKKDIFVRILEEQEEDLHFDM